MFLIKKIDSKFLKIKVKSTNKSKIATIKANVWNTFIISKIDF